MILKTYNLRKGSHVKVSLVPDVQKLLILVTQLCTELCFVVFFRPADAAPYDIKTSFPNRVYDDPTATLQECGLVPNATLHLLAKKV